MLFVSLREESFVASLDDTFLFLYTKDKPDEKHNRKGSACDVKAMSY
jgi:hypothetical protein